MSRDAGNLVRRISFAIVAIPAALGVVWLGGWVLAGLVAAIAALGFRELDSFARRQELDPLTRTGIASAALLPLAVFYALTVEPVLADDAFYWCALWLLAVLLVALVRRSPAQRPMEAVAVTVFGVAYTAGLPAFLLAIRHLEAPMRDWEGAWLVFTPLVIIWVCDTFAMFGGRLIGGPKLAPGISPGKTRSGAVCGVLGGMLTVPVLNALVLDGLGIAFPLGRGLLFAFVLTLVGQAGDLVESLFKREVGLKDSSALIPGHGGILDRFDSLYFALPAAAALYRFFEVV
jgi:phosphatidate cytidylyltransferase